MAFKIRDCDRVVNLSFNCHDEDSYQNCLFKASIIIKQITKFRDALIKGRQTQIELKKKYGK